MVTLLISPSVTSPASKFASTVSPIVRCCPLPDLHADARINDLYSTPINRGGAPGGHRLQDSWLRQFRPAIAVGRSVEHRSSYSQYRTSFLRCSIIRVTIRSGQAHPALKKYPKLKPALATEPLNRHADSGLGKPCFLIYMSLARLDLRLALYHSISRFTRLEIDFDTFRGSLAGTTSPGKLIPIRYRVVVQLIAGYQPPSANAIYHLPARHGATEVIEFRRQTSDLPSKAFERQWPPPPGDVAPIAPIPISLAVRVLAVGPITQSGCNG